MNLRLSLLLVAALAAAAPAQTSLRVACWNVETIGPPGSTQYNAALSILQRIDAEVVGIQEVASSSDASNLQTLAAAAGYTFVAVPSRSPFGTLRNAFLSRYPFVGSPTFHTSASLSGDSGADDLTRWIVEVTVDLPANARHLTLLTKHWKAGTGNDDEFRRSCESIRVTQALAGLDPPLDAYLVMGDVNDEIDSVPNRPDPFTSLPSGLPATWELGDDLNVILNGPGIVNDPFSYLTDPGGPDLVPIRALQKDGLDATRPASGRRLDYIFASQLIDAFGVQAEVYDSLDEGLPGGLPKSGNALAGSASLNASDHLLVFTDLTVPDLLVCQPDLGFGGPGSASLSVCGDPLVEGGRAQVELTGAPPSSIAFAVAGTGFGPIPFAGGQLGPVPIQFLGGLQTDPQGEISLGFPSIGTPVAVYLQFVIDDPGQPRSFAFSNTVAIEFLP